MSVCDYCTHDNISSLKVAALILEGFFFLKKNLKFYIIISGKHYLIWIMLQAFDKDRKLRAICGGGRYDKLLSTYGGLDTPACGFGFGDAVIVEVSIDFLCSFCLWNFPFKC